MQKQFFKRITQGIALGVVLVILVIVFVVMLVQICTRHTVSIQLLFPVILCVVAALMIKWIIPDSFEYWIRVEGDYIIFEGNETDHRPISRKYCVIDQNRKKIVLADERGTIISLAYNVEVLEFLKQHRIE